MIVFPIPLLFATFLVLSLTAWIGVTRCQKLRAQAAWLNRIPGTAWLLMGAIAIFATLLVGIGVKRDVGLSSVLAILPPVISIAFHLIADMESPRLGIISVVPENLMSLARVVRGP